MIEAINNDWLVANKVIAIFPQGQSTDSSYATWDNHAMLSGTDDSAFLEHISRYIISEYGISDIYLVGHSSGGIMVNRIWCERPDLFKAYISISGAASEFYLSHPCVPETRRPYLGVIGAHDGVLQVMGNLDRPTWDMGSSLPNVNFINPVVINEAFQHRYRSNLMCNEMPDQLNYRSDGVVDSWINCGGAQQLLLFQSGNHSVESLEAQSGYKLIDVITSFLTGPDN
ncbi:MAG: hypothetical protein OEY89_11455 [Gammaproteobacteria bacterium]|nr:hypothetical protein [Gammaproteobacteria bacterium]